MTPRWRIETDGDSAVIVPDEAALITPGDVAAARAELRCVLIDDGGYERGLATNTDPDLADQ